MNENSAKNKMKHESHYKNYIMNRTLFLRELHSNFDKTEIWNECSMGKFEMCNTYKMSDISLT